ncbi:S1 family peptidase [Streptosporangium sp. KLBMP 9127]|nr:S1 family peptidase [Streptosporangium sp. KLBMP 9127]
MKIPPITVRAPRATGRLAVALGVALAMVATGAAQATAAPTPALVKGADTRAVESADKIPGGFASWKDLLATQEKLVKAADRVTAAVRTQDDTGFAGIVAAPENRELRVYWKGDTPERISALIGQLRGDVPVSVLPAAYSARELESEMNRLARTSGDAITSIAPNADGSGLTVSGADYGLTRSKVADSAVPVTVEAGVTPTPASRWDDAVPWLGGAAWRNAGTGRGCSTGFAVTAGGTSWMLSAYHCGGVGQTATDPTGQVIGPITHASASRDVMLIRAGTAGRVYNNNPGTISPEFTNPVVGTSASYVGMWLCTSGAYSGTICLCQVKMTNVTIYLAESVLYGMVLLENSTRKNVAGQGDSGGPVETPEPSSTTQQHAVGVISLIDTGAQVPCTGYVISGRICSWRLYYSPWSNVTAAFPGIAIKTG